MNREQMKKTHIRGSKVVGFLELLDKEIDRLTFEIDEQMITRRNAMNSWGSFLGTSDSSKQELYLQEELDKETDKLQKLRSERIITNRLKADYLSHFDMLEEIQIGM